jgi:hypothetical protein
VKLFIWNLNDNDRAYVVHATTEDAARKAIQKNVEYLDYYKDIVAGPPSYVVEEAEEYVYFNAGWEY